MSAIKSIILMFSLATGALNGQTLLYTNAGNWSGGSGVDTGWTDSSVALSSTNGRAAISDPCFWLPVNITNKDSTGGVHCQVQLFQINNVFWNQVSNQPLQSPYGRRFNFDVRYDTLYGNSTNGANQWDINLLQFWQWATMWSSNGVPQQWVNGQPEFMLWAQNNSYGRQYQFKIYTDVVNATNNKATTEWLFQNTTNHPVTLEDGSWHSVSVYGSLATGATNSCVRVLIDGIAINWDKLTKTVISSNGTRGTAQVLAGPGTNITGCATLPNYGDFRARFGAYAYQKFGAITNFGQYLDNLAILTDSVYYVAPTLAIITNRSLIAGATLLVTNLASDNNSPAQALGYALTTKPSGASINATNGLITWRPSISQSGNSNQFVVVVTNAASLSATQSFWVGVIAPQSPALSVLPSVPALMKLSISGSVGPDYLIQVTTNLNSGSTGWTTLQTTNPVQLPFIWAEAYTTTVPSRFYRILLGP